MKYKYVFFGLATGIIIMGLVMDTPGEMIFDRVWFSGITVMTCYMWRKELKVQE